MSERTAQLDVRRLLPTIVVGVLVAAALLYIVVLAEPTPDVGGNWRTTTFGSAIDDWRSFVRTLLNGLTFASLLFIVASGFSLIFVLMRVVNMAYGSFFLVGGYVAYEVQQKMTGSGYTIAGTDVTAWEWIFPAIVAMCVVGLIGLFVQQVLLSWNQGQELRQALITIAVSVIVADQVISHFNSGLASSVTWPGWTSRFVKLPLLGVDYSLARLVVLALGVMVGLALWVWLYQTRTGLVIRAGVDDLQMTSALGVNIRRTLAIAFVVGSALAAFGGVVGASQGAVAPGQDGQWLLNSLVVVIIGGMGSLVGAAVGALLYGLTFSFAAVYLPTIGGNCCTQYSIIFTFILLALVLAFRPQGLFGKFS
jgi:branched-chain amino acid transport system permease protein